MWAYRPLSRKPCPRLDEVRLPPRKPRRGGIAGVDALHFAPSKHRRLLQAADLVSYLHFRRRRSDVKDARSVKTTNDYGTSSQTR
ncbi:DUF3800 domain-containing protein [Mycobacterium tuberculosis]|uniref:DUF3800 domain-containing protein n=1 Tax=Mycobacterium tuberculosis TaxID=1773 RepID=UPI00187B934F